MKSSSFISQEYSKRETAEAKLVKDLDRFEMILQAFEYEKGKKEMFLKLFFGGTLDTYD